MARRLLARWLLVVSLAFAPCFPVVAADPPASKEPASGEAALPGDAVTAHRMMLGGHELAYTATAGTLSLTDEKGEKTADIFYVAYRLDGADPAKRPITFAFNGGPGAGSAYLNIGAIGPRVLDLGGGRALPTAMAPIIDNPDTWLDLTDLVFVDPVDTGYSRPVGGDQAGAKEFLGVRQDLATLGTIVRLALTKLDRRASPVYLVGESYGGFRAARLPAELARREGISISGAVLISPVLEFSLMNADDFDPLPWALQLPSYAAVTLEAQGKLDPAALQDVEHFALGPYLSALVTPPADAEATSAFYATIARFIGVPAGVVARGQGRVPLGLFIKTIDRQAGGMASRYDGSVSAIDPDPASYGPTTGDPILASLNAPLTSGFVTYLRNELQFKTDRRYLLLNGDVERRWEWGNRSSGAPGAADDMSRALSINPRLKFLVAQGMTDLLTPYLASRYVVAHMPARLTQGRVQLKLYPGGHMMYLRPGSRAALHADVHALYGTPAP